MKSGLTLLLILFFSFKGLGRQDSCLTFEALGIDTQNKMIKGEGMVSQVFKGVHDTAAIDLMITAKDTHGRLLEGALVEILNLKQKKSDKWGRVFFTAFYYLGGVFMIRISHPNCGCVEIKNLQFGSGEMRFLEVILPDR